MRERVSLREIGLRYVLQLVRDALPTAQEHSMNARGILARVNLTEVTSVVPPTAMIYDATAR
jgi:hypothetical protein